MTDPMQNKCGAKTRNGTPCTNPPIKGANRCRMHGAAAGQVRAKAAERVELARIQRQLRGKTIEPVTDIVGEYLTNLGEVLALRDLLRAEVGELDQLDMKTYAGEGPSGEQARALLVLYSQMLGKADDALHKAVRIGVDEHLVKVATMRAENVLAVLQGVLDRLGLSREQLGMVPAAIEAVVGKEEA